MIIYFFEFRKDFAKYYNRFENKIRTLVTKVKNTTDSE